MKLLVLVFVKYYAYKKFQYLSNPVCWWPNIFIVRHTLFNQQPTFQMISSWYLHFKKSRTTNKLKVCYQIYVSNLKVDNKKRSSLLCKSIPLFHRLSSDQSTPHRTDCSFGSPDSSAAAVVSHGWSTDTRPNCLPYTVVRHIDSALESAYRSKSIIIIYIDWLSITKSSRWFSLPSIRSRVCDTIIRRDVVETNFYDRRR